MWQITLIEQCLQAKRDFFSGYQQNRSKDVHRQIYPTHNRWSRTRPPHGRGGPARPRTGRTRSRKDSPRQGTRPQIPALPLPRRTETHLHRVRRRLLACSPLSPSLPLPPTPSGPDAAAELCCRHGAPAARHHGPRLVRPAALPPAHPLSRARAAGGTQLVATRPPLISLWLVLAAGGPGRTGSWAWAGARRRTGPTAWRPWSPTTSPPSSPAAATPSPSATTDACVPPPPFPAAGLLRPLAREPLCSEFSF